MGLVNARNGGAEAGVTRFQSASVVLVAIPASLRLERSEGRRGETMEVGKKGQ